MSVFFFIKEKKKMYTPLEKNIRQNVMASAILLVRLAATVN
jgi:hypothetical protein